MKSTQKIIEENLTVKLGEVEINSDSSDSVYRGEINTNEINGDIKNNQK